MKTLKITSLVLVMVLAVAACSNDDGSGQTAGGDGADEATADSGYTVLDPASLQQMMQEEDVYLVNVHVPYEGELPDTDAFIPYTEITSRMDELPFGEQTVVIYCRSGSMSTEAAQAMVAADAPPFYELGGGWYSWQGAGLPFEVN